VESLEYRTTPATIVVNVQNDFFSPKDASVVVGDTVRWVVNEGFHTTTSSNGLWDSGGLGVGSIFEHTFNNPGDFAYICTIHFACCNMAGTVHVTAPSPPADLTIAKSHTGNFRQGDPADTYTVSVSNIGSGPTTGTVTVTDALPSVLTPTAADNGIVNGWTVTANGQTITATRGDVLAAGGSYPPLTLTVSVANNSPTSITNTATVAGGGEVNTANDSASDPTTITPVSLGVISGTVFHDYNGNGVRDPGEPGLAGQTVFVDLSGSGVLQPGDPTALSDANGNFQLGVQSAGTYIVRQLLLGGVLLSAPVSSSYQVALASGASATGQNFADVLTSIAVPLTVPPSTPFPKQGSANADYVEALYRAILDRNADQSGLANWTDQLNSGAMSRLQVVQGIRNSVEHFTQEVSDFYLTLLNRQPDLSGLQNWVQQLEDGTREEQIAFAFLNSPEYLSQGDKHFVDAMYLSLLGRSFDTAGEANWLSQLGDDTSGNPTHPASLTHPQVITAFLYSTESLARLTEGYYETFLQRPADTAGLNGWVGSLQKGASFLTIGQQFLASNEFYNQAAQRG